MGKMHASCYARIEDARMVGISDIDQKQGEKLAERYKCRFYKNPDVLIAESEAQIIDICTPTPFHKQFTLRAAQVGKHIICEKPIARTVEDADQMLKEVEKRKVLLLVGHMVRFSPEYIKIKELVQKGEVGNPAVIRTFRGAASPPTSWYWDVERSGGILVDLLIHDFDFLCWTFGAVDTIYALNVSFDPFQQKSVALVNLKFQVGSLAHVEGSWAHPKDFPFTTKVEVTGDKGLIQFDSRESVPVMLHKEGAKKEEDRVPESLLAQDPYFMELKHFIQCVQGKEKPRIYPQDAIQALEISLAALQSAKTGKPVKEDEFED